jgi:hypothetical protein
VATLVALRDLIRCLCDLCCPGYTFNLRGIAVEPTMMSLSAREQAWIEAGLGRSIKVK